MVDITRNGHMLWKLPSSAQSLGISLSLPSLPWLIFLALLVGDHDLHEQLLHPGLLQGGLEHVQVPQGPGHDVQQPLGLPIPGGHSLCLVPDILPKDCRHIPHATLAMALLAGIGSDGGAPQLVRHAAGHVGVGLQLVLVGVCSCWRMVQPRWSSLLQPTCKAKPCQAGMVGIGTGTFCPVL